MRGRPAGAVAAAAAVVSLAVPGPAAAAPDLSCLTLLAGTAGIQIEQLTSAFPATGLAEALPRAEGPERADLRTPRVSFNRRWEFALWAGRLVFRPRGGGPWRAVPVPPCLRGKLREISADDDELAAVDGNGRIYVLDGVLSDPLLWTWTRRWGRYFWTGTGHRLPAGTVAWSYSDISPVEDGTYLDSAGNPQAVGTGKVTTIYALRRDRRTITVLDPWLANDYSYEVCGPEQGRLRLAALSASGSTIAVLSRGGRVLTRLWDFDIAGSDPVFFRYSYADQRGRPDPKIQLPSPGWVDHGRPPGRIAGAISVHKAGTGSVHRIVRVPGIAEGERHGFFELDVADGRWRFVETGERVEPLPRLRDVRREPPARAYGPARIAGAEVSAPAFHHACTPTPLRVGVGEETLELRLHAVDGLRQEPRAEGLDGEPRRYYAAIEVPPALTSHPWVERVLGGRRFTETELLASAGRLRFPELGWTLELTGGGPPDRARRLDIGSELAWVTWRLQRDDFLQADPARAR